MLTARFSQDSSYYPGEGGANTCSSRHCAHTIGARSIVFKLLGSYETFVAFIQVEKYGERTTRGSHDVHSEVLP